MKRSRWKSHACGRALALGLALAPLARAASFYPLRPDDPQAIYATPESVGVVGDGKADDTAALQRAIDRVQETTRRGIVFIPSGRYRLSHALLVWSGIRLIGYGATRPVFVLGEHTPGYQAGDGKYLVHFVSDRPERPDQPVGDANPGTFYSAMSNLDLEIRAGNPAAVGVRSHYAQHGYLAHMDFWIGDGRAGVEEVGNESEDLHFHGGEFGITMHKPSPSWPFLLIDSSFDGQRRACIETEEGGLTLVRVQFKNAPTAILVREHRAEELWAKDARFEHITGPALVIGNEANARTQINLENAVCVDVPVLAAFRESGRTIGGDGAIYRVKTFSHGLRIADIGAEPKLDTVCTLEPLATAPTPPPTDIAALPPMETWANLRTLGAKGDGTTDDTAALRAAIATHRAIYLPSGRYRVTEPIALRPDTVLIGLNPITTQILITDFTPAFQGVNGPTERPAASVGGRRAWFTPPPFAGRGAPVPMLATPRGGANIVAGLGLDTGGANNRAVALRWSAGEHSLVNDVRFLGGHGTYGPDGQWLAIYNDTRTADPDPRRRWDSQFWSLWVTDGGGGTFKDIWTPSTFAAAGIYISDTDTPGRIYALSSEHHVRNEVKLRHVAHWNIYALQTEEERGESPHALPLEIDDCHDVTVANFFIYRVDMPTPAETGIRVTNSHDLRFRGLHVYSPGKLSFDNTLIDQTHQVEIRSREIAALDLSGAAPAARAASRVEKLASGFTNIDGAAVDAAGNVYFVDEAWSRIYRWAADGSGLTLATDAIPQPVALAFDRTGRLLVVAHHGNVYTYPPGASEAQIGVLTPTPTAPKAGATLLLPTNRWRDSHDWASAIASRETVFYTAPDGTTCLPAPEAFAALPHPRRSRGYGTIDVVRAYQFGATQAGEVFYASDEFEQKTWRLRVQPDGSLTDGQLFAQEGEAGVTTDAEGHVYVCAGQVFVYDADGHQVDRIDVPERPSSVVFGGADRRTLYIATRSSLYAWKPPAAKR